MNSASLALTRQRGTEYVVADSSFAATIEVRDLRARSLAAIVLILFVAILACSPTARSQTTADILGTVTDSSGAVIPNAQVVLTNLATGVAQQTHTNNAGDYLFTLVLNGTYSVKVAAPGFKAFSVSSVQLEAGARQRIDAHLELGAQTETVTVSTAPPAIQTDSSSTGTTLSEKPVEDLPLNGRNFINLVQIAAGMNNGPSSAINNGSRPDDRRQGSAFTANALDPSANNNMVDGMDNNERIVATLGVRPSVDSIGEVQILTGNYTAEIARTGGGAVNVITKGGTKQLHGSAYEFIRNDALDARDVLAVSGRKPELRQNQFGASVGGPIKKDRAFFFGDYEGLRIVGGVSDDVAVPTNYEEGRNGGVLGDFSDIGGPTVPSAAFDTAGLNYFKMYPACNYPTPTTCDYASAPGVPNYYSTVNQTQYQHIADGRVDYRFTNGDPLFYRYTFNKTATDTPGFFPEVKIGDLTVSPNGIGTVSATADPLKFAGTSAQKVGNMLLTYSHPFTQNLILELKAGYTRINIQTLPLNYGEAVDTAMGIPNANISQETSGLSPINLLGGGSYAQPGGPPFLPIQYLDNTFQYSGGLTFVHGKQTIKAGGTIIRRQLKNVQADQGNGWFFVAAFQPAWNVGTYPQLSTGVGQSYYAMVNELTGSTFYRQRNIELYPPNYRSWEPGFYVQDDWHVLPWLTLNMGVRYDVYTPYTEVNNHIADWNPDITNAYGGKGGIVVAGQNGVSNTAGIKTDHSDVQPRFGFAATIRPKTVLRGGFGITDYPTSYASGFNLKNPPFVSTFKDTHTISTPYPAATASSATYPTDIPSLVDPNYRSAYLEQMNLTLQQEFMGNVVTATYVGLLGRHTSLGININQIAPNTLGDTYYAQSLRPYFSLYCGADPTTGQPETEQQCAPNGVNAAASANGVTSISPFYSEGTSSFHALETTFERRPQKGLGWNVNYTWEHATDYGATAIVPSMIKKLGKENGSDELEDRIAASVNYELPFAKSAKGFLKTVAQGWQANTIVVWQTGVPFTVLNSSDVANTDPGNNTSDRPNQVAGWRVSNPSNKKFFNTAAFQQQPAGTIGNETGNQLYGPHFRHWDVSAFKNFMPTERLTVQFRSEFFNVTNTPNWGNPDYTLTDSTFGQISSTAAYQTPRQIQFALKVLF